jgi:uracil-DNA glycosylase
MTCEICNKPTIRDGGNVNSPIILAGEFPGMEEINKGVAFVGRTGEILKAEMIRAGIAPKDVCLTNLWLHDPDRLKNGKPNNNTPCYSHLTNIFLKKIANRKLVLLMGSDFGWLYGGDTIGNSGLEVEYDDMMFMVSPNPAIVMHSCVGEFRLALEKFAQKIAEMEL